MGGGWRSRLLARALGVCAAAVAGLGGQVARAQTVPGAPSGGVLTGIVLTTDAAPVSGATVTITPEGRGSTSAVTTEDGTFAFGGAAPGSAVLRVRRLGFRPESLTVLLPRATPERLAVQLTPTPQTLAPVVVRATRELGPIADFYRRRERGFGRFITRADIARRNPVFTTDLLRAVAGVAVYADGPQATTRVRGALCAPEVYIDGTPVGPPAFDLNSIPPNTLEGIEVYSGGATVPVEYTRPFGNASCGTLLFWTRRGEPRPRRDGGKPVTSEDLARLVESLQLFTAEQVDRGARPTTDLAEAVRLPDSLRGTPVNAGVVAEFVVDSAGRVESPTVNIVAASAAVYAAAVRAALPELRFSPAVRAGRPVRQLVQLQVRFDTRPGAGK